MKILKGNYGECRFQDCIEGMKGLSDQSYDLCLTDPPYNVNLKGNSQCVNDHPLEEKIEYEDNLDTSEYMDWNMKWFHECQRITSLQIISTGHPNLKSWLERTTPKDYLIHFKPDGQGLSSMCYLTKAEIFLMFGKNKYWSKNNQKIFPMNYIKGNLYGGFNKDERFIHPCPKSYQFWKDCIIQSQQQSILDCFLGSGTTAQVCETLGIKWLGFELKEDYAVDIKKRIQLGIKAHQSYQNLPQKQLTLI